MPRNFSRFLASVPPAAVINGDVLVSDTDVVARCRQCARSQVHLLVIYIVTVTSCSDFTDRSDSSFTILKPWWFWVEITIADRSDTLRALCSDFLFSFDFLPRTTRYRYIDIRPAGTREKLQLILLEISHIFVDSSTSVRQKCFRFRKYTFYRYRRTQYAPDKNKLRLLRERSILYLSALQRLVVLVLSQLLAASTRIRGEPLCQWKTGWPLYHDIGQTCAPWTNIRFSLWLWLDVPVCRENWE